MISIQRSLLTDAIVDVSLDTCLNDRQIRDIDEKKLHKMQMQIIGMTHEDKIHRD